MNQRQDFSRASRTDGLDHLVSTLAVRVGGTYPHEGVFQGGSSAADGLLGHHGVPVGLDLQNRHLVEPWRNVRGQQETVDGIQLSDWPL